MFRRRINRYPTGRVSTTDDLWFTSGLGNMARMYGDSLPQEFERLARRVQGPTDSIRDWVGPFIYGFSYTFNPAADEPLFVQEFGNVRDNENGLLAQSIRLAFVDLTYQEDTYRVSVEVPGVVGGNIDLRMNDDSMVVNTTGDIIYHSHIKFFQLVNPDTAKATTRTATSPSRSR